MIMIPKVYRNSTSGSLAIKWIKIQSQHWSDSGPLCTAKTAARWGRKKEVELDRVQQSLQAPRSFNPRECAWDTERKWESVRHRDIETDRERLKDWELRKWDCRIGFLLTTHSVGMAWMIGPDRAVDHPHIGSWGYIEQWSTPYTNKFSAEKNIMPQHCKGSLCYFSGKCQ